MYEWRDKNTKIRAILVRSQQKRSHSVCIYSIQFNADVQSALIFQSHNYHCSDAPAIYMHREREPSKREEERERESGMPHC